MASNKQENNLKTNHVKQKISHEITKTYQGLQKVKTNVIKKSLFVQKASWLRRFFSKLLASNPLIKALILYLLVIFVFAGILMIKGVVVPSVFITDHYDFFNAFFCAVNTITCTGMMLTPIISTYTVLGQVIIFLFMEFGSVIFSFIVSNIYMSFRSNAGNAFNNQVLVQIEKGEDQINGSLSMMKWSVFVLGGTQIFFALSLFICFYYIPGYMPLNNPNTNQYFVGFAHQYTQQYHHAVSALWSGVFDSVGGITNAGMTLFGFANLSVYRNGLGILVQFLLGSEFILGGIGFPLFYDLILKIKMRARGAKYKLSMYSKLSVQAVLYVTLFTTIFAYIFAYTDHHANSIILATNYDGDNKLNTIYSPWGKHPLLNKNWAIFFNVLNTHSAGYTTINLDNLSVGSKWVYIISMFIGCSPSSSAGEIKLVILVMTIYYLIGGLKRLFGKYNTFKKSIQRAMVLNSFMILILGIAISIAATAVFYCEYEGQDDVRKHLLNAIFLGVSVYSMCAQAPGDIFSSQSFYGQLAVLIVIIASQMIIVFSMFIVSKNSFMSDKAKALKLQEIRQKSANVLAEHIDL